MMMARTGVAALGVAAALLFAACGNGPPAGSEGGSSGGGGGGDVGSKASGGTAATTFKETDELKFSPNSGSVKVGDVVEWDNTGSVAHNVTFDQYS